MLDRVQASQNNGEAAFREARHDVRADAIRFLPELIASCGGDPETLLRAAGIDPRVLSCRGSILDYRAMVDLFERSARQLQCPDFGMRLAALQGGTRVMGPVGIVMKNSRTLGQALGYCARQLQAYSPATRVRFVPDRDAHTLLVQLQILLDGVADKTQLIEHDLLLAALNVIEVTGGVARVRHVYFQHIPRSSVDVYQAAFGCQVSFDANADGIVFYERDLLCPVFRPDADVREMATSFIAQNHPRGRTPLHARLRSLIRRFLDEEDCSIERIAAELFMHARQLQRHLQSEGLSFEGTKDDVRREVALRYLQGEDMPLAQIAKKLGYSGSSALSRSCVRWFSASPQRVRTQYLLAAYKNSKTELGGCSGNQTDAESA